MDVALLAKFASGYDAPTVACIVVLLATLFCCFKYDKSEREWDKKVAEWSGKPPKADREPRERQTVTNHLGRDGTIGGGGASTPLQDTILPESEKSGTKASRAFEWLVVPIVKIVGVCLHDIYVLAVCALAYAVAVAASPPAAAAAGAVAPAVVPAAQALAGGLVATAAAYGSAQVAESERLHDECVHVTVRTPGENFDMAFPLDTTVGFVKARALIYGNKGRNISKAMCHCTLQKTKGAHLQNDQRLGDLDVDGKTLMLGFRGCGGAGPTPEATVAELQSGLYATHDFMLKCKQPVVVDQMLPVYNGMVEQLYIAYKDAGVDPTGLDDVAAQAEQREVRPFKLAVADDGSLIKYVRERSAPRRRGSAGAGSSRGAGAGGAGGGSEGDDPMDLLDEDNNAGVFATDRSNGEFWTAASKDPSKDPRNMPLGEQWLPDKLIEDAVRADPTLNPTGEADFRITDENRHHFAGLRCMDHSLSGLKDEGVKKRSKVFQHIGKELFMKQKQPTVIRTNDDGSYVRVASPFLRLVRSPWIN